MPDTSGHNVQRFRKFIIVFVCGSSQRKGCSFVMEVHMKYVVIGGVVLWVLFSVTRSLLVASHRADEQLRKFMQNGEDENGVYERS